MTYYTIDLKGVNTRSELKKRFNAIPRDRTVLKFNDHTFKDLSDQYLAEVAKLIPAQILTIDFNYSSLNEKKLTVFCQALPPTIRSLHVDENGLSANFLQMLHGKKLTSLRIKVNTHKKLASIFADLPPVKLLGIKCDREETIKELIGALPVLPKTINCLDLSGLSYILEEQLIEMLRALPPHITRIKLDIVGIRETGVWRRVLAAFPQHLQEVILPESALTLADTSKPKPAEKDLILDDEARAIEKIAIEKPSYLEQAVATGILDHHTLTFSFAGYYSLKQISRTKRLNQQVGRCIREIANTAGQPLKENKNLIDVILACEGIDIKPHERSSFFNLSLSKEDNEALWQEKLFYINQMLYESLAIGGIALIPIGLVGFAFFSASLAISLTVTGAGLGTFGFFKLNYHNQYRFMDEYEYTLEKRATRVAEADMARNVVSL